MEAFQERLEYYLGDKKLDVVWNKNKQTVIRVVSFYRKKALISIHEIFKNAPDDIIQALVHYVFARGRIQKIAKSFLRGFIEEQFQTLDLSNHFPDSRVVTQGINYNLEEVYKKINKDYFGNDLDLRITWYGRVFKKRKRSITFGEYLQIYRLIKIHRQLDQKAVPDFYLEFVVYHEMLHAVIPPYINDRGILCMHGREFRDREKKFTAFRAVKDWEESHQKVFFG